MTSTIRAPSTRRSGAANDPTANSLPAAPNSTAATTRRTPATSAASSRFTSDDSLVLTVDPSFQYVKANGGGTSTGVKAATSTPPRAPDCDAAFSTARANLDLRPGLLRRRPSWRRRPQWRRRHSRPGHGCAPSQTKTSASASSPACAGRSTTTTSARHLHPGSCASSPDRRGRPARRDGEPFDVFPVNDPRWRCGFDGVILQKRDRKSLGDPQPGRRASIAASSSTRR